MIKKGGITALEGLLKHPRNEKSPIMGFCLMVSEVQRSPPSCKKERYDEEVQHRTHRCSGGCLKLGGVAQLVEHSPSTYRALNLVLSISKIKYGGPLGISAPGR